MSAVKPIITLASVESYEEKLWQKAEAGSHSFEYSRQEASSRARPAVVVNITYPHLYVNSRKEVLLSVHYAVWPHRIHICCINGCTTINTVVRDCQLDSNGRSIYEKVRLRAREIAKAGRATVSIYNS